MKCRPRLCLECLQGINETQHVVAEVEVYELSDAMWVKCVYVNCPACLLLGLFAGKKSSVMKSYFYIMII